MKTPKKRNKKRNFRKTLNNASSVSLRFGGLGVWFTCNFNVAHVLSKHNKELFLPSQKTADLIVNFEHNWHYTLFVMCREQSGKEYIVSGTPNLVNEKGIPLSERKMYQKDLADALDEAHHDFKKKVNQLHIVNTGWVAFPFKCEVSEEYIDEVATKYKCWDYPSKYQYQLNQHHKKVEDDIKTINYLKMMQKPELGG